MFCGATNRPLYIRTGEPFIIPLPSNPTTGYSWMLTSYPPFIRILDDRYYPGLHPQGMVGSGVKQVFTLIADFPGAGILHFDYARPWEAVGGTCREIYLVAGNV